MQFNAFTSRFDDRLIQDLLGEAALKLLTAIDPALSSRSKLIDLAVDLHTPAGLLLDKAIRSAMFDLLHPNEAEELATVLGLPETQDVYTALKNLRLVRGSGRGKDTLRLFRPGCTANGSRRRAALN